MKGKHMCFDTNSKLLTQGSSLKNYKAKKKKIKIEKSRVHKIKLYHK